MKLINSILANFLVCFGPTFSQIPIGTIKPDKSSALDITSLNRGVLIPRVQLISKTNNQKPINNPANSLLVFNTTENNELNQGYYYWSSDKNMWVRLVDTDLIQDYYAGIGMFLDDNNNIFTRNGLQELKSEDNSVNSTTGQGEYGWRYIGLKQTNYARIGKFATDLSYVPENTNENTSDFASLNSNPIYSNIPWNVVGAFNSDLDFSNMGSAGKYSFTSGLLNNTKKDFASTLGLANYNNSLGGVNIGGFNSSGGKFTIVIGSINKVKFDNSLTKNIDENTFESYVIGSQNHVHGNLSVVLGSRNGNLSFNSPDNNASGAISGTQSVVIGLQNGATGENSIAMGVLNLSEGDFSTTLGSNLVANSHSSIILGTYNTLENDPQSKSTLNRNKRTFVLGNGQKQVSGAIKRADAITVIRNGKVGIGYNNFENRITNYAKLQVNGAIQISNNGTLDSDGEYDNQNDMPCNEENVGTIRYTETGNSGRFEGCRKKAANVYEWVPLHL